MPKKKKLKKLKKREVNREFDFELYFDDRTMSETEGSYKLVKNLIESEFPYPKVWNIKTTLSIVSPFGEGVFVLDFRNDRGCYIIQYTGGLNTVYNPDLSCLSRWCQASGWNIPEPTEVLIQENTTFWKYMWETLLVNSVYLDARFGLRKQFDVKAAQDMSGRMETMEDDEI